MSDEQAAWDLATAISVSYLQAKRIRRLEAKVRDLEDTIQQMVSDRCEECDFLATLMTPERAVQAEWDAAWYALTGITWRDANHSPAPTITAGPNRIVDETLVGMPIWMAITKWAPVIPLNHSTPIMNGRPAAYSYVIQQYDDIVLVESSSVIGDKA